MTDGAPISATFDGKYELVRKLGQGGMGEVHEAREIATGRSVALKIIVGHFVFNATVVARFHREAKTTAALVSPHIAEVIDSGNDEKTQSPYLVMELLVGGDVDELVKRTGPLRPTLALRIVGQALEGLAVAHRAKVVHRDIKPANLYLAETADAVVVKVVDFGIAKVKDDLASSREAGLTQTAAILGSPLYMSPEQARASKTVDARADLWSLGVVLYQLLAGVTPNSHCDSLTEILLAICTSEPRPVQELAPWVPPAVASIVDRALRISVTERYTTAEDMLADIAAIVPDYGTLRLADISPLDDDERGVVAETFVRGAIVEGPPPVGTITGDELEPIPSSFELGATLAESAASPSSLRRRGTDTQPSAGVPAARVAAVSEPPVLAAASVPPPPTRDRRPLVALVVLCVCVAAAAVVALRWPATPAPVAGPGADTGPAPTGTALVAAPSASASTAPGSAPSATTVVALGSSAHTAKPGLVSAASASSVPSATASSVASARASASSKPPAPPPTGSISREFQ